MRTFVSLLLTGGIIVFALFHYDVFVSGEKFANTNNPVQVIQNILSVTEITYYKDPFFSENYVVIVHADEKHKAKLTPSQTNALKALGMFTSKIREVWKMPVWGFAIIIVAGEIFVFLVSRKKYKRAT